MTWLVLPRPRYLACAPALPAAVEMLGKASGSPWRDWLKQRVLVRFSGSSHPEQRRPLGPAPGLPEGPIEGSFLQHPQVMLIDPACTGVPASHLDFLVPEKILSKAGRVPFWNTRAVTVRNLDIVAVP